MNEKIRWQTANWEDPMQSNACFPFLLVLISLAWTCPAISRLLVSVMHVQWSSQTKISTTNTIMSRHCLPSYVELQCIVIQLHAIIWFSTYYCYFLFRSILHTTKLFLTFASTKSGLPRQTPCSVAIFIFLISTIFPLNLSVEFCNNLSIRKKWKKLKSIH